MQEQIELVVAEEKRKAGGISLAIAVSMILHGLLIVWFVRSYRPVTTAQNVPIARYVELIKQNPQQFTEAPGAKTDTAPLNAPLSNANRKASTPEPTGTTPTQRPGDGSGLYTPPMPKPGRQQQSVQPQEAQPAQQASAPQPQQQQPQRTETTTDPLIYREPVRAAAAAQGAVDWRSAIRDVRKVASLGGGDGPELENPGTGGDKGLAEQGPLSFETQWYDWGDYAQSMVSKIRVNWYANMPQIIRTGLQGVATIRFTIHRDGHITDVTVLKSSGAPPYDFAAKKAIELSSPLNALPADFPRSSERVTAMFYYNTPLPN
ncbi:MAG TPA: energy transducer TonB [Thermoanaerobaculia bacterium]|nr:energy transducer TonB [Thermoanaerobaculia bacterium]